LRKPIKNLDQKIRNIARREPTNWSYIYIWTDTPTDIGFYYAL
jgi:hypothetical protein